MKRYTFACGWIGVLLAFGCDGAVEPSQVDVLCTTQTEIPEAECRALFAFYEATDKPAWMDSTGWGTSETPCSWEGVGCENGYVVDLSISARGLTGTIPPELGNLSKLRYLYLFSNHLTGTIPPELGNLSELRVLFLRQNELTGAIPAELGNLSDLERLALSSNDLTDPIPPEIGNLFNLDLLWLFWNGLDGAIPLSVAQLGGQIQDGGGLCDFLPGNNGLLLPDTPEYRAADLDSDGFICEVPIL